MPDNQTQPTRASRERNAISALQDYRTKGTPYVLYLRHYGIEVPYGAGDELMFLDTQLVRSLGPGINVVSIQDQKSLVEEFQTQGFERLSAGLRVGENWQSWVSELIFHADMIVQELALLSDGCRWELQKIHELRQNSKTVVIIPAPEEPFATLDPHDEIKVFGRCIYGTDPGLRAMVECPQAADLVKRLRLIAEHPEVARTQPSREHPGSPPITYEGVVQGLLDEAERAESHISFGFDIGADIRDHLWHASFWNRYRATNVLQILVWNWKTLPMRSVVKQMASNYFSMAEACITHHSKRSFPDVRSQVEFGHTLLINALLILQENDLLLDNLLLLRARRLAAGYAQLGIETPSFGADG